MAIDDNKDYMLKGSQIKDLSDKIKAKADQANTYTKSEVDGLIPDVSGLATKTEVTEGLALKADKTEIPDISGLATKTEVTEGLATKADKSELPDLSNYYTKSDTDTLLDNKENLITAGYGIKKESDVISFDTAMFVTGGKNKDGVVVPANGRTNVILENIAPEGYSIVAVRQVAIEVGTGGTQEMRNNCFLQAFSTTGGGKSLQVQVKSVYPNDATIKISGTVFCMRLG